MRLAARLPPAQVRAVEVEFGGTDAGIDGQAAQAAASVDENNA
jgi:hypothetical protein